LNALKNKTELMVDLAFHASLTGNRNIAKQVIEMKKEVDNLELQFSVNLAHACRFFYAAKELVVLGWVAHALGRISDAASEIASLAIRKLTVPVKDVYRSEEVVFEVKVHPNSSLVDTKIEKVVEAVGIFTVLSITREGKTHFHIRKTEKLRASDVLVVRGNVDVARKLRELCLEPTKVEVGWPAEVYIVVRERLHELKNLAEALIDLSLTALLLNSREVAERVVEFGAHIDNLEDNMKKEVVGSNKLTVEEKLSLIELIANLDALSDAATEIAKLVQRGLESETLVQILGESEERISVFKAGKHVGKTLAQLGLKDKAVIPLVVKRGDEWIVMPPYEKMKLKEGDVLVVKYPADSATFIDSLLREEEREDLIEEIREIEGFIEG